MVKRRRHTYLRKKHRSYFKRLELPCAICGDDIDYSLPHTDKMSFALDHVNPIANDGSDGIANKQPTHRKCNASKTNKVFAEGIIKRSSSLLRPIPTGDTPKTR